MSFQDAELTNNFPDSCVRITYGYIDRKNELIVDTINQISIPFISLTYWGNEALIEFAEKYSNGNLDFRSYFLLELSIIDGLFIFQDDSSRLFGYKDIHNNIKIDAKFRSCRNFRYGLAVVYLPYEDKGDFTEMVNTAGVIDTNGNLIFSDFSVVQDYNEKGLTWALSTSISLEKMSVEGDWVQLDRLGNIKMGPISINGWVYNNEQYPICAINMGILGTYYTFLDENGNYLTDFNKDRMLSLNSGDNELFIDVTRFSKGIAGVKYYNQKGESAWFFADRHLNIISEPYDSVSPFSEGLAAVEELTNDGKFNTHLGKWGYVKMELPDTTFVQVIPFSFSVCGMFSGGLAYFMNQGATFDLEGYINKKGEVVWQTKKKKK